jgi:lipoprotein-anchoring transpeptidase ErfK/SrfK
MRINYPLKTSWMLVCFGLALMLFAAAKPLPKTKQSAPEPKPNVARVLPATSYITTALAAMSTEVRVDLSEARVYSYWGEELIADYPVAVGQPGWETPIGTFKVLHKQINPTWKQPITGKLFPTGPNNPLGDRWIGFWSDAHHQIGFHGTNKEDLVGQAVSHGCLRMRNADIRALYKQVSIGTPVIVQK